MDVLYHDLNYFECLKLVLHLYTLMNIKICTFELKNLPSVVEFVKTKAVEQKQEDNSYVEMGIL